MYKLRTSIVKHENPEVATLCMLFFLLLLYYLCKDSKVLNYYTTLSVEITNGASWSFCLLSEKLASVLLENRTAPQGILWLQSLHVSNMGESAWKVRSIHWFSGSAGETLHTRASISARKRWSTSESPCFVSPHLFPLLSHYLWGEGMNNFSIFPFKICETNLAPPPEAYGKVEIFSENQYPLEPQFTRP